METNNFINSVINSIDDLKLHGVCITNYVYCIESVIKQSFDNGFARAKYDLLLITGAFTTNFLLTFPHI